MDEDPRFPNRKKKRELDMSALGKKLEELDQVVSSSGETDAPELPLNVYRIVESPQKSQEEELAEQAELYSFRASMEASDIPRTVEPQAAILPEPAVQPPQTPRQDTKHRGWNDRIRTFAESQTRVYAAVGIGMGILIGVIVAGLSWFSGAPSGRYDLGTATSSAAGLKGQLFVEWEKRLNYRVTIEPSEPARQAAFALAVAHSPRPLSIEIRLQDSEGFVLCSKEILLKYDAGKAVGLAGAEGSEAPAPAFSSGQIQGAIAQPDAQEAAREQGKDTFSDQTGSDGEITAINAQGATACTAKAYEKVTAWSFASNFPSVAEQDAWLERENERLANGGRLTAEPSGAHKKEAPKPAQKLLPFSVEGDDTIVDFDLSRGVVETGAGKVFSIERAGGATSDPRWQEYPVEIHYRCDRSSECTITHAGAGALRVRLRR